MCVHVCVCVCACVCVCVCIRNSQRRLGHHSNWNTTRYYNNNACGGGTDFLAYAWLLQQNGGNISSADDYGLYMNQDGYGWLLQC
jgi:hypothetical protein